TPTSTTELYPLSLHDALPILGSSPNDAPSCLGQAAPRPTALPISGYTRRCELECLVLLAIGTRDQRVWQLRRVGLHGKTLEEGRSEEHTSELQSRENLVCRLL